MLLAILILLQVVQANDFVSFKVCFLDTMAHPWEFRPHPEDESFYVRAHQILYVSEVSYKVSGIDCVRVCSAQGCKFVIGTVASVMATLRGPRNAGEESRQ